MSDPGIKIRTIPRPNEKAAPAPKKATKGNKNAALATYSPVLIALGIALAVVAALFLYQYIKSSKRFEAKAKPVQPAVARHGASITKQMHDTQIAELMLKRRTELENQRTMGGRGREDAVVFVETEEGRILGVQMDQENLSEKVYEDLYGEKHVGSDGSPDDRINARLANRKWLNEMERAERLNFIKNFIRQAYDRGYEVELDQNLVVTSVKKITAAKKVNIDEVLNRLAKQGH